MKEESALALISKAWGRRAKGYVFFPWIDRKAQQREGRRQAGFHEGPAFSWPADKAKIVAHMKQHHEHDLYWCPTVFEEPVRSEHLAQDEGALWADLDEADPRQIEDYPPTIAWETSPGRYQALWLVQGQFQGASWPGNENQRLTYHLGADASGWDTVQLLRIPGWANHKPEYRKADGSTPQGKLLWSNGRVWMSDEFSDLPPAKGALPASTITEVLEDEIAATDRHEVLSKVKLKLNQKARDLIYAREVVGDRSSNLWYIIRCLADAGCTVAEIVAVARTTVWNKFEGRADELKRLILEASKAISQRSEEVEEALEEERTPKPEPSRLSTLFVNIKPPKWLIDGILTQGAVGFIGGQPKSFKSWIGLDLAISVATGTNFLNYFRVTRKGPVLMIQEEDGIVTIKDRATKIWRGKSADSMEMDQGDLFWLPGSEQTIFDPPIGAMVQEGVIVSDPAWQEWLDYSLEQGFEGEPYALTVIDTFMMVAGDVEENRSQLMTSKVFRPLKQIMRKHDCTLQIVHHMKKTDPNSAHRPGQLMLGSVAGHAWTEDSLYLSRTASGDIGMFYESKTAPEAKYRITIPQEGWTPYVSHHDPQDDQEKQASRSKRTRGAQPPAVLGVLRSDVGMATGDIAAAIGGNYQQAWRQLGKANSMGLAYKDEKGLWRLSPADE